MSIDLSGQTVLIIGGMHALATGVGQAFQIAGATVLFAYDSQTDAAGALLQTMPTATAYPVTLRDPQALEAQLASLPPPDTVVVSPGWFAHTPFLDVTEIEIELALAQNIEHCTYAAQAAAKQLIAQGNGGNIIFLSSVASLMPFVHTNLAGSSLAALEVIAKMAAVDLGAHNIRVNIVAAGWLQDDWSQPLLTEAGQLRTESDVPLRRVGTPQTVGEACIFLASPLSDYITGAVLPVDGGYLLTKSEAQSPYPEAA